MNHFYREMNISSSQTAIFLDIQPYSAILSAFYFSDKNEPVRLKKKKGETGGKYENY